MNTTINEGFLTFLPNGCLSDNGIKTLNIDEFIDNIGLSFSDGQLSKITNKKLLPAIMANGSFTNMRNEGLQSLSLLYAADIDYHNDVDAEAKVEIALEKLRRDDHAIIVQKTFSGNGIWSLFNIEITNPEVLDLFNTPSEFCTAVHNSVCAYLLNVHNLVADPNVKDISRKRAISKWQPFCNTNYYKLMLTLRCESKVVKDVNVVTSKDFDDNDVAYYIANYVNRNKINDGHRDLPTYVLASKLYRAGISLNDSLKHLRKITQDYKTLDTFKIKYERCERTDYNKTLWASDGLDILKPNKNNNITKVTLDTPYISATDLESIIEQAVDGINIISAPTGAGKTTALLNYSIISAKSNGHILIVEPTKIIRDSFTTKLNVDVNVKPFIFTAKAERLLRDGDETCTITVSQQFKRAIESRHIDTYFNDDPKSPKITAFFFDEAHLLLYSFKELQQIYEWAATQTMPIFFITATPDEGLKHAAKKFFDVYIKKEKRNADILTLGFCGKNECDTQLLNLLNIVRLNKKRCLVYFNDLEQTERLIKMAIANDPTINILHLNKDNRDIQQLYDNIWDVCFTTNVLGCGIDLIDVVDTFITYDIAPRFTPLDINQFINRERIRKDIYIFNIRRISTKNKKITATITNVDHNKLFEEKISIDCFSTYDLNSNTFSSKFYSGFVYDLNEAIKNYKTQLSNLYTNDLELYTSSICNQVHKTFNTRSKIICNNDVTKNLITFEKIKMHYTPQHFLEKFKKITDVTEAIEYLEVNEGVKTANEMLEILKEHKGNVLGMGIQKMRAYVNEYNKQFDEAIDPVHTIILNNINKCAIDYVNDNPGCIGRDIIARIIDRFDPVYTDNHSFIRNTRALKEFLKKNGCTMNKNSKNFATFSFV